MSEINNLIAVTDPKIDNKQLRKFESSLSDLRKIKKTTNKEVFKSTYSDQERFFKTRIKDLKAGAEGRIIIDVGGEKIRVKKSYLNTLKNPENYIKGLYGRKVRNYQKKAYKAKNYKAVTSLSKKLKGLKQKQGVSQWKQTRSLNIEKKSIVDAFKFYGQKVDPKKIGVEKITNIGEQGEPVKELISDKEYREIVTLDEEDGIINILYVN